MPRRPLVALAVLLAALGAAVTTGRAAASQAATMPAAGAPGHDVSWPQCSTTLPADGSFGVVGVNDGRAWSTNPCLAAEYQWAAAYPRTPDIYMNTANPAPQSGYYWPASGASDPVPCHDATSTNDPGCAYDYGWHTAADAMARLRSVIGSQAQGAWWLDVETGNTWNGDASSNAADLQGSIDYLTSQDVEVGVYSTPEQWAAITGGYSAASASTYATAWAGEFTSANGIADTPSWVAGASGPAEAASDCGSSFLGTSTWMAQYIAGGYDSDYGCGPAAPPPPPPPADYAITAPAATARTGAGVTDTVTLRSLNGWSGTVALTVSAPAGVSATLSTPTVALGAGSSRTDRLTLRSTSVGRYTITVTVRPAAGSSTSAVHTLAVTFTVSHPSRVSQAS